MYTKKQREEILAEFGASDLSAYAFCRQVGLSRVTLRAWQREAASQAQGRRILFGPGAEGLTKRRDDPFALGRSVC